MKTTIDGYDVTFERGRLEMRNQAGHLMSAELAVDTPDHVILDLALQELRFTRERHASMNDWQLKDEFDRLAVRKGGR